MALYIIVHWRLWVSFLLQQCISCHDSRLVVKLECKSWRSDGSGPFVIPPPPLLPNSRESRPNASKMISLLLLPFLVQLAIHLVNTFGATTINDLVRPPQPCSQTTPLTSPPQLWQLYCLLPTSSPEAAKIAPLRREVLQLKRELATVSAQDEFSKWARIRRKLDKATADYEAQAGKQQSTRARFDSIVNKLRWVGTTGLRYLLQFWFSKVPVFWLPAGWVPAWAEWLLAFPRAPSGAVSIQVWWIACASVIALVGEAVGAGVTLVVKQRAQGRKEGVKMSATAEKKEL